MEEKYLPIGTVVTKKGSSKKFMIVGYSPVVYTGKLTTYDYSAYPYPEGIILKNQDGYFNHEEIEKVDYMGYKGVEYQQFLSTIMEPKNDVSDNASTDKKDNYFNNIKFDENGIVIFDGTTNDSDNFSEELKDIQFDENGFVVSAGGEKLNNPFVTPVDIEGHKQPDENKDMSIFKDYKFDENGFVISDETADNNADNSTTNSDNGKYKFDENGVVVEEKDSNVTSSAVNNLNGYKFDENGVVISDGTETMSSANSSQYQFDSNGFVIGDKDNAESEILDATPATEMTGGYKFDENGFVVSE